jgi:hypothetical protein
MTIPTSQIDHSRYGLFFTRLDCQSNAKPFEKDHDLPRIRTQDLWNSSQHTQPLHHLGRHVPMRFSRGCRKLPWITGELSCLKNKKTKAAKRSEASKNDVDETIDDCECEQLRREFFSLREECQLMRGRAYVNYRVGIENAIKSYPKTFFGYVNLKKKRVGYLVLMTSAIFFLILYNEHNLMMHGCLLIPDLISCRITHLLVLFSSLWMRYRVSCWSKGAGPDGIPPLILKNCASAFARPLSLLFNRSLSTFVFAEIWKLSYVAPIFKKGRRNNAT